MRWLQLFPLVLLLVLGGCALNRTVDYLVPVQAEYRLDTGDEVRVTVYGDEGLTNVYRVSDKGVVALPLGGNVKVRGLTTDEAAVRIVDVLEGGYLVKPNVAVEVVANRPFFIQGAVRNPGQFPFVYGMTLRSAISTGGGYTEFADRSRATVYRRKNGQMSKSKVGLDFPLLAGDTIVIQERWF